VHAPGEEQLATERVQRLIGGPDQALRAERSEITLGEPARHVHAVAGEEHAEALDALCLLGLCAARREGLQERQTEGHSTKAAQEAAP
jgi:hypothetical protein